MTGEDEFHGSVHQDLFLGPGAREVEAVITVEARGGLEAAMSLRLWTPLGVTVRYVHQIAPTRVDLSGYRIESGPLTGEYPVGSWAGGIRDYRVCMDVEPGEVGEEKLACRMSIVHAGSGDSGQVVPHQTFQHTEPDGSVSWFTSARVRAFWSEDSVPPGPGSGADQFDDPDTGTFEIVGTPAQDRYSRAEPVGVPLWWALVAPDRGYFEASGVDTGRFCIPAGPARRVQLTGGSVRIGRRSGPRGIAPEIDVTDPGVSRVHARLLARPDGSWTVVDDGSLNGTYVNGAAQRIGPRQQVPLADGDRVHVGVWTTITLHRESS
ncbi:MAG TPA: FHA domain-containing protein [Pseudonocardiaceae bacterium]